MIGSVDTERAFASLPWYDLREVRSATDRLWREMAQQFRWAGLSNVPGRLNRDVAYERQWTSSGFLFGQACGYDARIAYAEQLQIVATPCYDVPDCSEACYRSYVVVREDAPFRSVEDMRGTRCVINTPTSHSGMNVLRALVAPLHSDGRFFSQIRMSGSHERSLRMIQRGQVDVAAIDCVTYAMLARYRPHGLAGSRVLFRTDSVPAPPYVTAASTPPEKVALMRQAVARALEQPSIQTAKRQLFLRGVEILNAEAYLPIELLVSMAHHYDYGEIPGRVPAAG